MKNLKQNLLLATVILLAALSGYALQNIQWAAEENQAQQLASNKAPSEILIRPEFAMTDIHGQLRDIKEWDGKVILLNFWATWCPPCLKEIPDFIELQNQFGEQGFQVIGVAVDNEKDVRRFADEMKMNYPVMAGEYEAIDLSRRYGNNIGGLPYSVIINRKGEISDTFMGELSKIEAEKLLRKLNIKS